MSYDGFDALKAENDELRAQLRAQLRFAGLGEERGGASPQLLAELHAVETIDDASARRVLRAVLSLRGLGDRP